MSDRSEADFLIMRIECAEQEIDYWFTLLESENKGYKQELKNYARQREKGIDTTARETTSAEQHKRTVAEIKEIIEIYQAEREKTLNSLEQLFD